MIDSALASDREHVLEKTSGLWESLRGERIFITGGTGFVGKWMVEAFVAANHAYDLRARVCLLTRDPARFSAWSPDLAQNKSVELVAGDVTSFEIPAGDFRFMIHAATERWFEADDARPLGILERDFAGTRRVLDLAAARGVRRFLFTSSGAVYGDGASLLERVGEDYLGAPDPTERRSAYGESKRISEFACTSYGRAHGFDVVIGRLFAFVGPYLPLDEGYAIGNFLADVLAGRAIRIGGDGTARRSYLYAADLAIWLWTLLLKGAAGKAYNVGSPQAVSTRELADVTKQTLAPDSEVTVAGTPLPGAAPSNYVPDTSRAERELGLRSWIGLPEALRRTYAFHLASAEPRT